MSEKDASTVENLLKTDEIWSKNVNGKSERSGDQQANNKSRETF